MDDDREAAREQRAVYAIIAIALAVTGGGVLLGRDDFDFGALAILAGALGLGIVVGWRSRARIPRARVAKR